MKKIIVFKVLNMWVKCQSLMGCFYFYDISQHLQTCTSLFKTCTCITYAVRTLYATSSFWGWVGCVTCTVITVNPEIIMYPTQNTSTDACSNCGWFLESKRNIL